MPKITFVYTTNACYISMEIKLNKHSTFQLPRNIKSHRKHNLKVLNNTSNQCSDLIFL